MPFTRFCAAVSRASLALAIVGLLAVIACVQWQVFGRYVMNDTPTWAEALAMLLVLFVTGFGLAVGVRDAGHIGLESLVVLLPQHWQRRIELLIHALIGVFGMLMVQAQRVRPVDPCAADHRRRADRAVLDRALHRDPAGPHG